MKNDMLMCMISITATALHYFVHARKRDIFTCDSCIILKLSMRNTIYCKFYKNITLCAATRVLSNVQTFARRLREAPPFHRFFPTSSRTSGTNEIANLCARALRIERFTKFDSSTCAAPASRVSWRSSFALRNRSMRKQPDECENKFDARR